MTVLVTIVVIIIVVGAVAVLYDHQAKRHGRRTAARADRTERENGESV
jgi:hypothetical protein